LDCQNPRLQKERNPGAPVDSADDIDYSILEDIRFLLSGTKILNE